MRKVGGFIFLILFLVVPALCQDQDTVPDYGFFNPELIYNLAPGKNIIIEMPEGTDFTYKVISAGSWETDDMYHFIWVQAKEKTEPCKIRITRKNDKKGIELCLYCQEGSRETPFKIIVRESDFNKLPEDVLQAPYVPDIKAADQSKEKKPEEKNEVKEEKRTETQFGLSGGLYGVGPKKNFNVAGDFALAAKFFGGVHVQGNLKIDWNGWIKCFGQSIGLGLEPPEGVPLGLFVFLDTLEWKIQDFMTTFHAQIRPAIRLRFNLVHLSAWYAVPVTDDRMVAEDAFDEDYAIYNSQIPHFGFDVLAQFGKRMRLNVDGLIGSSSLFRVGGNVEFKLSRNFRVIGGVHVGSFGKYPLLQDEELDNSLTASLGLRYVPGKVDFDTLKKRLIFPPDYPIVTSKRHKKEDDKNQSTKPLYITLDGEPKTGYVPLAVTWTQTFGGGKQPYRVEFMPAWKFEPLTSQANVDTSTTIRGVNNALGFIYTVPGKYTAKSWIYDSAGNKAESNEVIIIALPSNGNFWNIIVTAGTGGRVTPGSTQVANGADSPLFRIVADSGYNVDYVLIDGQNKGPLSEYQFKAVDRNHTLDAFFSNTISGKFTINSSAGTGLSIDPSGSRQYNAGANADYTVTVVDPDYAIDQVLVDGSPVATSPASPYVYHFTNIQANHSINATSKRARYTITATAGPNGSINPSGEVKVNAGAYQSFTITANTGYAIESVMVDGSPVTFTASPFVYTFPNVSSDHTISATFKVATFTIKVDHSFKGHTVPGTGVYTVNYGDNFTIENKPDENCQIDYMTVDGNGVPNASSYTFYNVTKGYNYYCAFKDNPPPPVYYWIYTYDHIKNQFDFQIAILENHWEKIEGSNEHLYKPAFHPAYPNFKLESVSLDGVNVPLNGDGSCDIYISNIHENHTIRSWYKEQV